MYTNTYKNLEYNQFLYITSMLIYEVANILNGKWFTPGKMNERKPFAYSLKILSEFPDFARNRNNNFIY